MSEVQKKGIEETKQVIKLAFALAGVISSELKDGFQLQDLVDVFQKVSGDPEKKALLESAIKDIKQVPDEVKSMGLMEVAELVAFVAPEVVKLVAELKKD